MENKRVIVYHPNPWGNGTSLTWVWCTPFDGPLTEERKEFYISHGWTFTYEDVEIKTN